MQKLSHLKKGWNDSQLHRQHLTTSLLLVFLLASQLILEHTIPNILQPPLFPHLHPQCLGRAIHSPHSLSYTHLTLPIHPLICQLFHQQFLLALPTGLLQQCQNHPSLWCSSLGIYPSVLVALTITLNLQCLRMIYMLDTLNGGHLHLMEHLNQNLLLLTTM